MEKKYTKYWKKLANEKNVGAKDVIVHCALKAFFAKSKDNKSDIFFNQITRSFTPVTKKIKLANGCTRWNVVRVSFDWPLYSLLKGKNGIFGLNKEDTIKYIFENEKQYDKFVEFLNAQVATFRNREETLKKRYYTYIFVDQDKVEPIYQTVQASHVAMVLGQKMNKNFDSANIYFQICKKPSELTLNELSTKLSNNGFKVEEFFEPDVNRTIAIGTHPVVSYRRGVLLNSELLTF